MQNTKGGNGISTRTKWFYRCGNNASGPLSEDQLHRMARSGKLLPTDQIRREGAVRWQSAGELIGLFPSNGPSETPPAPAKSSFAVAGLQQPLRFAIFAAIGIAGVVAALSIYIALKQDSYSPEQKAAYRQAIAAVLMRDAVVTQSREEARDWTDRTFMFGPPDKLAAYLGELDAIDVTACPPEFQSAWVAHKRKWRESYQWTARHDGVAGVVEVVIDGLAETDDFAVARQEGEALVQKLNDSWHELEVIGLKFGAQYRPVQ